MKDKSKVKKASKVVKTIVGIASTGVAVATAVVTMNKLGIFDKVNPNPDPDPAPVTQKLDKVENLTYDKDSQLLTWDSVANADQYRLNINGDVQTVNETSISYTPSDKNTTFRVQAIDSTGYYLPSEWSDACIYTMEDQKQDDTTIDLKKVNKFVNELTRNYDLVKIASMYIDDEGYHVQGWFKDSDGTQVVDLECYYDEEISTLEDAMTKDKSGKGINNVFDRSYYDPAVTTQYLLDSDNYIGGLEDARLQGYDISSVSSCVGRISSTIYRIYGTYKLQRGEEVKYVQSEIECCVVDPSRAEVVNYTEKLLYNNSRHLEEKTYHELTGDLAEWAMKYDEQVNANTNSTQSTIGSDITTADMEYGA